MNVLIAPNAFKGCLSAPQAGRIMARSLPRDWEYTLCPIADGGDGTLDCLVSATDGRYFKAMVTGPLAGTKVIARWGFLGKDPTAIIEMAEASGLRLLSRGQYSPSHTTTFGVGELVLKALEAGYKKIFVGLGGSATNDGGSGCADALGARFLDSNGNKLPAGGIHLLDLAKIDISLMDTRLEECEIVCLADVNCVLSGPTGTSRIYARQKGASNQEIELLDDALAHFSQIILHQLHIDFGAIPGSGAAGGLAAGLIGLCNARAVSGTERILDLIGVDQKLSACDAVITGEGRIDEQTLQGKGVAGIGSRAKRLGKQVHVFAGRVSGETQEMCRQLGVDAIHQITPGGLSDEEGMKRVEELLEASVRDVVTKW